MPDRVDDTALLDPPFSETETERPIPPIGDRPTYPHITASEMLRVALCPGSFKLRLTHPEQRSGDDDAYAETGTDGHECLRTDDFTGLDQEETEFLHTVIFQRDDLIKSLLGEGVAYDTLKERRYYLRDGLKPLVSGQLDHIAIAETNVAVATDYKLLWGDHTSATYNLQLRTQAVLLAEKNDFAEIFVAIVQPKRGQPSVARYDQNALARAKEEILGYVARAHAPNAPLIPGRRQCRWCPAKLHCPAARENMDAVRSLALIDQEQAELDNPTLLELYEKAGSAIQLAEKIQAYTKRRLKVYESEGIENELTAHLMLKEKQGNREVTDSEAAYQRLFALLDGDRDKTAEVFARSVAVRIGELEKQYRNACQIGHHKNGRPKYITHKLAKADIEQAFEGLIEHRKREPEVVRVEGPITPPLPSASCTRP